MLAKSKRSAVIMAIILLSAMAVVNFSFIAVRSVLAGESLVEFEIANIFNFEEIDSFSLFVGLVLFLGVAFIAVFSLVFAAQYIYLLGDRHFGLQGAMRWAIMGVASALIFQLGLLIFPDLFIENSASEAVVKYTIRIVLGLGNIFVSYSLAFKWLPQSKRYPDYSQDDKSDQTSTKLKRIVEVISQVQQNPETRFGASTSWYMIGLGILSLLIGLMLTALPDPYLFSVFIVSGIVGILMGSAQLPRLQGTKMSHWLTRLSNIGFVVVLLLVIVSFVHWR